MEQRAHLREGTSREEMLRLLSGVGVEIGALQNPAIVPHLKVRYIDRLSREEAFTHYPELIGQNLVTVDIIDDAEDLRSIHAGTQDFVIANHVIEHMANPIKALRNWGRVLKTGGRLFLAVPDRNFTFDHERPLTPIEHLFLDYEAPDDARDFQHFAEFAKFVSCRTFHVRPESESDAFAQELWEKKYSIHYHVWEYDSFLEFIRCMQHEMPEWGMSTVATVPTVGNEFILVLEKVGEKVQ